MAPQHIIINNKTDKTQSYVISPHELFILESTKHVLVTTEVEPGTSGLITIDSAPYVWAKLTSTSTPVYAEAEVGAILSIQELDGQPVIRRITGTPPEPGCFAIVTRSGFRGKSSHIISDIDTRATLQADKLHHVYDNKASSDWASAPRVASIPSRLYRQRVPQFIRSSPAITLTLLSTSTSNTIPGMSWETTAP